MADWKSLLTGLSMAEIQDSLHLLTGRACGPPTWKDSGWAAFRR